MKRLLQIALIIVGLLPDCPPVVAAPPFSGTIFLDPDIITPADPTTFQAASYAGQGFRWMFDRRVNNWTYINAYLFDASFTDGLKAEIQVNPEFGNAAAAQTQAQKYAQVIGRLPTALRLDVDTVSIHQGTQPFGGGNNNLLIHTGQADLYAADGILEETLVHEATHTSLDADHAAAPGWLAAVAADGEYISTYARDNPTREDVAESFLPYLAVRYRADRISQSLANTISQTIPHRMDYFDSQPFNLYPLSTTLLGDFNRNGVVDGADYVRWRNGLGTTQAQAEYNVWRSRFGLTTTDGSAEAFASQFAVPEPPLRVLVVLVSTAVILGTMPRRVAHSLSQKRSSHTTFGRCQGAR
jgi:hypothetical protein